MFRNENVCNTIKWTNEWIISKHNGDHLIKHVVLFMKWSYKMLFTSVESMSKFEGDISEKHLNRFVEDLF